MAETPFEQWVNVKITDKPLAEKLDAMCESDERDRSKFIRWLIDQEWQRREVQSAEGGRRKADHVGQKDEKHELVRRILRNGGRTAEEDATVALHEYMTEHDSPMSLTWCRQFVQGIVAEMNEAVTA